jgi:hypothetical protein
VVPNREPETPEALTLAYKDIITERDRLRDARGSITSKLGPLPASAGIAISLVGALAQEVSAVALGVAVSLFLLLISVSITYSLVWPYRRLRAKYERELALEANSSSVAKHGDKPFELGFDEHASGTDWLEHMIKLERRIYGSLDAGGRSFRLPFGITNLQDGFDAERTGLVIVQLLFVAVIGTLVVGVLVGR